MAPISLSAAEQALLRRYQELARGSSAQRWAVEVVPPLLFVGLWMWTGRVVFLLVLIAVQVGFNLWRVLQQRRALAQLQSIADKALAETRTDSAAQGPEDSRS